MANILVYGDSIAHGDYDSEGGWVDRLKKYLKTLYLDEEINEDIDVYNLCVDGDTSSEVLKHIEVECKARCWDKSKTTVIFAIGINDAIIVGGKNKTSKNVFKNNLEELYLLAKNYTTSIIFVGLTPVEESKVTPMPWSPTEYWYSEKVRQYDMILKNFCIQKSIPYIYVFDKLTTKDLYDGAHPNTKGNEIIFETVGKFLIKEKFVETTV